MAPPAANSRRSNSWRSWRARPRAACPPGVLRRLFGAAQHAPGRDHFQPAPAECGWRRGQEPRIGTGPGCWAASLTWIWRPVFRHCVGGGKRADALRRRSRSRPCDLVFRHCVGGGKRADALRRRGRAKPCDLHPGVGDDLHPASSQAGLRSTSHCTGPLSAREIPVRRSPRQRGPIGEVCAAAYVAPLHCEICLKSSPQAFPDGPSRGPRPRRILASAASPILIWPGQTVPCRAPLRK